MAGESALLRVVVVGGGVSGLAAAHRLLERARETRRAVQVHLYEAGPRLGGTVATRRHEGFLIEEGPDSFLNEKPWARFLAVRLGLGHELIGTDSRYRRSFVVRDGRVLPTPEGFQMLAPSRLGPVWRSPIFSLAGKLRISLEPWVPRRAESGDESLGSFVRRRFGREALERIAQPMAAGIYGADPDELSLEATFPRFPLMEREHGSVLRGLRSGRAAGGHALESSPVEPEREAAAAAASGPRYGLFASFAAGMQSLTDALAAHLPPGVAHTRTRVEEVRPAAGGSAWTVRVRGREQAADAVILALPAHAAVALARPFDPALAAALAEVRYGSSAVVSLGYPERAVPHPLDGAGLVVPAAEGMDLIACSFSHRKFPGRAPAGHALLRAFYGERALALRDDELIARATADLYTLLDVSDPPALAFVSRHRRATPHYRVGHRELAARIEERAAAHPGLLLTGNGYRGVGIPDCVRLAEAAAEAALAGG